MLDLYCEEEEPAHEKCAELRGVQKEKYIPWVITLFQIDEDQFVVFLQISE